jgi:hypothetical protein
MKTKEKPPYGRYNLETKEKVINHSIGYQNILISIFVYVS